MTNEKRYYNEKILRVYVDFYNKKPGFNKTFEKAIDSGLDKSLERDQLALRRLLLDVINYKE